MELDVESFSFQFLVDNYDDLMLGKRVAKGFTIGRGKKLYWYISPFPSGRYRCLPIERGGSLGWPRWLDADKYYVVTVHYKGL